MEKYKAENINIREWVERGIVTAIPGPTIDYDYVYEDVIADSKKFSIVEVCYDSWHSNNLIKRLDDVIPDVAFVEKNQSLKSMTGPAKNYERLIIEDKIVDPNPVSKWMVSNATIKIDANNNYKPLKEYKSSTKRIDSVITSIMALDRRVNSDDVRPARSFDDVLRLFK
jgi:phage terminase large subunit-like protein